MKTTAGPLLALATVSACRPLIQAAEAAAASPTVATVRIDATKVIAERPHSLIGANIEDLNFQLYGGLYSQLLHGECFEEHDANKPEWKQQGFPSPRVGHETADALGMVSLAHLRGLA